MAARLEKFSQGGDVIISEAIYNDPEVQEFLNYPNKRLQAECFMEALKGFDNESFTLWRLARTRESLSKLVIG